MPRKVRKSNLATSNCSIDILVNNANINHCNPTAATQVVKNNAIHVHSSNALKTSGETAISYVNKSSNEPIKVSNEAANVVQEGITPLPNEKQSGTQAVDDSIQLSTKEVVKMPNATISDTDVSRASSTITDNSINSNDVPVSQEVKEQQSVYLVAINIPFHDNGMPTISDKIIHTAADSHDAIKLQAISHNLPVAHAYDYARTTIASTNSSVPIKMQRNPAYHIPINS